MSPLQIGARVIADRSPHHVNVSPRAPGVRLVGAAAALILPRAIQAPVIMWGLLCAALQARTLP